VEDDDDDDDDEEEDVDGDDEVDITPDLAMSCSILLFTSSPTLINGGPIHLVTYLLAVNNTIRAFFLPYSLSGYHHPCMCCAKRLVDKVTDLGACPKQHCSDGDSTVKSCRQLRRSLLRWEIMINPYRYGTPEPLFATCLSAGH
jgi:hypothetical protein